VSNANETSRERAERLIREGKLTAEAVANAEAIWREYLREGTTIPNGERITVTLSDLYHVIVDPRISRKPERIERALLGIFEIRQARYDRREALTSWEEDGKVLSGIAILDTNNTLRSLHIVDHRRLRRAIRKEDLLWKR
jgi:hypothetical protein